MRARLVIRNLWQRPGNRAEDRHHVGPVEEETEHVTGSQVESSQRRVLDDL